MNIEKIKKAAIENQKYLQEEELTKFHVWYAVGLFKDEILAGLNPADPLGARKALKEAKKEAEKAILK